jgi:type II secretory ATPase GspE/PulE/Tfp pilus assembly ATPase PilB-like protein
MAGLNIAEKRLPQDGRIRRKMGGREVDLRVSTVPVRHGERVVMRILEKGQVFSLDRVGMGGEILAMFRKLIRLPHGILLVSGPTGSGKSTTLYSAISEINEPDVNILTIEDPVEYEVKGIGQVQVNHKIELTFASALRSFLRQDPDVILVGEIRDRETAENAVQASLTGHMVFSDHPHQRRCRARSRASPTWAWSRFSSPRRWSGCWRSASSVAYARTARRRTSPRTRS